MEVRLEILGSSSRRLLLMLQPVMGLWIHLHRRSGEEFGEYLLKFCSRESYGSRDGMISVNFAVARKGPFNVYTSRRRRRRSSFASKGRRFPSPPGQSVGTGL
ncbi:hypothetical protein CDL12_22892 [Handroanthus impetiginosus]|uniref:Uncharacterized protein n=1 Tax=Handroanthus impetiginosus TaxID=429701 RepID=A0A2G9GGZ7_9LAMI|nr:hypothetical protein CDL12_22892 [Handroanthus impetiginosus]